MILFSCDFVDEPPLEPPILLVSPASTAEDTSVRLQIYVRNIQSGKSGNLTILIKNAPKKSTFSAGKKVNNDVIVFPKDLVNLTFTPPPNVGQTFNLSILVMLRQTDGRTTSRSAVLPVRVTPVADKPFVTVNQTCIEKGSKSVKLEIFAALMDEDGSEVLTMNITSVPSGYKISHSMKSVKADIFVVDTSRINDLQIYSDNSLKPFNVTAVVAAQEKVDGNMVFVKKSLGFQFCKGK